MQSGLLRGGGVEVRRGTLQTASCSNEVVCSGSNNGDKEPVKHVGHLFCNLYHWQSRQNSIAPLLTDYLEHSDWNPLVCQACDAKRRSVTGLLTWHCDGSIGQCCCLHLHT